MSNGSRANNHWNVSIHLLQFVFYLSSADTLYLQGCLRARLQHSLRSNSSFRHGSLVHRSRSWFFLGRSRSGSLPQRRIQDRVTTCWSASKRKAGEEVVRSCYRVSSVDASFAVPLLTSRSAFSNMEAVQNLRTAIYSFKLRVEAAEKTKREKLFDQALNYLYR